MENSFAEIAGAFSGVVYCNLFKKDVIVNLLTTKLAAVQGNDSSSVHYQIKSYSSLQQQKPEVL